jgi:hypothetical protein
VKRRHVGNAQAPGDRFVQVRDVKMDDVEVLGALGDSFHHEQMGGERIGSLTREPKGARPDRNQRRIRTRVTGGKERDTVALSNELVSEISHNTFRPAVELRWNAFTQWCDLGNSQWFASPRTASETAASCIPEMRVRFATCGPSVRCVLLRLGPKYKKYEMCATWRAPSHGIYANRACVRARAGPFNFVAVLLLRRHDAVNRGRCRRSC